MDFYEKRRLERREKMKTDLIEGRWSKILTGKSGRNITDTYGGEAGLGALEQLGDDLDKLQKFCGMLALTLVRNKVLSEDDLLDLFDKI